MRIVRVVLAMAMLAIGLGHVIPTVPEPSLHTLTLRLGELTRAELVNTTLGYSEAYQIFNGVLETAAGLLLLFPVTALLGSVISAALLTNATIVGFCYDLPGKPWILCLWIAAVVLIAPHAKRLFDALVWNRVVEPVGEAAWPPRVQRVVVTAVLVLATALAAINAVRYGRAHRPRPRFYGVWNIEELRVDGEEAGAWRRLIVDRDGVPRLVTAAGTARLCTLTLRPAAEHVLVADGTVDGAAIHARLRRMQLLQDRFHWLLPPEEAE